jgi:heptosyltransferase I
MANAVGTPVIGLYATSNPARSGPYASRSLTVNRYPDAVAAEFGKPIQELRWGQRVRDPAAMDLITVADVTEKVTLALSR